MELTNHPGWPYVAGPPNTAGCSTRQDPHSAQDLYQHGVLCSQVGQFNRDTKTQLRFGPDDIEVLMKTKNSCEGFKCVNLEELEGYDQVPEYDFTRSWTVKPDRPPRRKIKQFHKSPSPSTSPKRPISRQSSTSSSLHMTTKKAKNYHSDDETNDIKNMSIEDESLDVLYISLADHEDVHEIHVRRAEVQNDKVTVRNFIPPQILRLLYCPQQTVFTS